MSKQKGFTTVEALIALVIFALLLILITPQLKVYYAQNRLKAAAEGLYDDILNARMAVIKTNTAVTFSSSTGATWCYGLTSGTNACSCSTPATCTLGAVSSTNYPNTTLAGLTSVTFDAVRATPNNTGTVTFSTTSGSTNSVTLTLSALGTTTLCSPSSTVGGYAGC